MTEPSTSPAGTLNKTDWTKGIRGAAITYLAAMAVQMMTDLSAYLDACAEGSADCRIDFGAYDVLIPACVAAIGFGIEMLRRYRANYSGH
jgi:hypothetical protein